MYKYTDKIIKYLNSQYLTAFNTLKKLPFDELNIIKVVHSTYKKMERLTKKLFLDIALYAYDRAVKDANGAETANGRIDAEWVEELLEEYDPVTLYVFNHETERKASRLAEAIIASPKNKKQEVNKALRYWAQQTGEYAVRVTDDATIEGFRDAGVKKVQWIARDDEKTCPVCGERDGKIYPIDEVPPKPHYHCRCYFKAVI